MLSWGKMEKKKGVADRPLKVGVQGGRL